MIGVAALKLGRGARGVPVAAYRGRQIKVPPSAGQRLVDIDLPLTARTLQRIGTGAGRRRLLGGLRIAEGIVTAGGVAVGGDHKAGLGFVNELAVAESQALAAGGVRVRDGGLSFGDIDRHCAERGVDGDTHKPGPVVLCFHAAGIAGQIVVEPVLQRTLHKPFGSAQGGLLHFPRGHGVAPDSGAQQLHHRSVRNDEGVLGAIGLVDGDVQIAAVAGGVQIIDLERTGGYRGFQYGVAVLGNDHARIRLGNSTHDRRVLQLGIRQHLVIARQGCAAESKAVEDGAIRKAVAHCQVAADRGDVMRKIGGDILVGGGPH